MSNKPITEEFLTKALMNSFHDFWESMLEPKFKKIDKRFDNLETDLLVVKRDINEVKHKVSDIQADLADTPTRKEFTALKAKVDLHHPTV